MAQPTVRDMPPGSDEPRRFESLDPRTGEVVGTHPVHTAADVAERVTAARAAATWWAALGFAGRKHRLDAWRRLILRRVDELAALVSAETGKPADDARLELVLVIDHLHWAADNAERVLRRRKVRAGLLMSNQVATIEYHPMGVVGVIGPWNYPVFTPMGSIAYALAAGNAVVFKPSEYTPGVGEWLADTFAEVVPEHPVSSVVTGPGETGAALCRVRRRPRSRSPARPRPAGGAWPPARRTLTPVLMECGGKDALIVADDADVEGGRRRRGVGRDGQRRPDLRRCGAGLRRRLGRRRFRGARGREGRALHTGSYAGADLGPMTMP